jgi:hypothetical protein
VRQVADWLTKPLIALLYSPWFVLARKYLLKPALFTLLTYVALAVGGTPPTFWPLAGIFLGLNFLLNTRLARNVEEISNDVVARAWLNFHARIVSGLYWLIVDLSKAFLEGVDRLFYATDEWLRFRRGESRPSLAFKAVLGVLWSLVTYVVRFAINLLIEPQINPIKHFPVVTVSHKVVWSLAIAITPIVANATGWDTASTGALLSGIAWAIPGIFGFLAWELKENWKLYAANRPATLRPVAIGHHGETMLRLLRPGFHSGTVPKLFRKIRRAHRKARQTREPVAELVRKHVDQLDHVRHSLVHYVERELFYLLRQCPAWRHELELGEISLATNRICIELRCEKLGPDACQLTFEEQKGWLLAGLKAGWAASLAEDERESFRDALIGLYKTSGVELVRQHLQRLWQDDAASYRITTDDRLAIWPADLHAPEVTYPLDGEAWIEPHSATEVPAAFPLLRADELLFSLHNVAWSQWVATWDDHAGHGGRRRLLAEVYVLPSGGGQDAATSTS